MAKRPTGRFENDEVEDYYDDDALDSFSPFSEGVYVYAGYADMKVNDEKPKDLFSFIEYVAKKSNDDISKKMVAMEERTIKRIESTVLASEKRTGALINGIRGDFSKAISNLEITTKDSLNGVKEEIHTSLSETNELLKVLINKLG